MSEKRQEGRDMEKQYINYLAKIRIIISQMMKEHAIPSGVI